ncbi:hypothetical protein FZI85_25230 [Mycobacterium sp. CBMA293]|uniref:hypothetical protein n=1 Tax=unclassified Mycolicibacterium TaxID=2636767 RepID=UPI0012DF7CC4|nr:MULTISPECIES: hypothetical protein [unclassified Mycolicibacterium]MUL47619.1 hypothetical protein [Mycolicibacterium sp. CBMA 360]MUL61863.1 hypothetical protein [Mycolicibacterium sp. CBMA 335]MUL68936.1 hypothetical protein [Mycolicibacterium sp. CBMA 311]MUL92847.1 hypothetical protein [Mycolicibacterium sp. CBMA 230]MUM08710.1 hypothetical protein [Mycolicibacterium sp. CBMA 213]
MFDVATSHQIVAFGNEMMKLFECATAAVVVTATRADGVWTVHAEGIDDVTAIDRGVAVTAMTSQLLAAIPGTGCSTTVPHGIFELP